MEENSLPQEKLNPAVNNTQKGISKNFTLSKIGIFKVVFAAVGLLLLFGTLNYFNILSISDVFPKYLSWLPRQTQQKNISVNKQKPIPTSTPTFLSNPLVAKAKGLGYNVIKIDPNDTTGRTVFYENRATLNNEGVGVKKYTNINNKEFIAQIVGEFDGLEEIQNSSDKYLLLINPVTKEKFPSVRISMDTLNPLSSTVLIVEDLNYNGDNASLSAQNLGLLGQFSGKDIEKILHKGDSITVGLTTGLQGNPIDENKQLESLVLYIRRFGGKAEIEKEAGRNL